MSARIGGCCVLVVALFLTANLAVGQDRPAKKKEKKAPDSLAAIEDTPGLPRVLLIGDSISMGYTLPARKLLEGVANVHRIPENGGPTIRGLAEIDKWLGDGKWDLIHFNWGLHDLKRIKDAPQVPLDQYEANLEKLVARLEKTGATLIWASTTPVPKGAGGRTMGDEVKYNEAARRVMEKHHVDVNDLYAFALPQLEKIQQPANVHFSEKGSKALAAEVAAKIKEALASAKK